MRFLWECIAGLREGGRLGAVLADDMGLGEKRLSHALEVFSPVLKFLRLDLMTRHQPLLFALRKTSLLFCSILTCNRFDAFCENQSSHPICAWWSYIGNGVWRGSGKTLQVLALVWSALRQGPAGRALASKVVVVTPSSLCANWAAEAKKWLGPERLKVLAYTRTLHSPPLRAASAIGFHPYHLGFLLQHNSGQHCTRSIYLRKKLHRNLLNSEACHPQDNFLCLNLLLC